MPIRGLRMTNTAVATKKKQKHIHSSTAICLNFFDDLFKVPSYPHKKKDEPTANASDSSTATTPATTITTADATSEAVVPDVPDLQAQQSDLQKKQDESKASLATEETTAAPTTTTQPPPPAADKETLQEGTVNWFNTLKGYGFIYPQHVAEQMKQQEHADNQEPPSRHDNIFVHYSDIHMEGYRRLRPGQSVRFRVRHDPDTGKRKAVEVQVVRRDSTAEA